LSRVSTRKSIIAAIALVLIAAIVIVGASQLLEVEPASASSCTLTIFRGEVSLQQPETADWISANDGMSLVAGDKIKTAPESNALITFLDGSTVEMEPETELSIVKVDATEDGSSSVGIKQWVGRTWSRVARLVDAESTYEVETLSAVAVARGTLIDTEVTPEGTTTGKAFEGAIEILTDDQQLLLPAGQEIIIPMDGSASDPSDVSPPASQLRVAVSSEAWLQLIDPLGRSVGIVPPGIELNQIPSATASGSPGTAQTLEINEPLSGESELILYSQESATVSLDMQAFSNDVTQFQESRNLELEEGQVYRIPLELTVVNELITQVTLGTIETLDAEVAGQFVVVTDLGGAQQALEADFVAGDTVVTPGQTIQFTDLSLGDIDAWAWDFGDGQTSTEQNPDHAYAAAGTYPVSLTVSESGDSDMETRYIFVYDTPQAALEASPTDARVGQAVQFADQSVGNPSQWAWDFGDGETSNERRPIHRYSSPGIYDVSLTVINGAGSDTLTIEQFINVSPEAWTMYRHDEQHTGQSFYPGAETLSLEWSYATESPIYQSSSTISPDGTLYIGSDSGVLYALSLNGSLIWTYSTGDAIESSPAIARDGTLYVGSADGRLYALYPSGALKWSYLTDGAVRSSPLVSSDGTVYVGSDDNYLYALNSDGTLRWRFATGDDLHWSSPALGSDGTLYVGSSDGSLYALNPNGTLKWSYATGDALHSSPAIGPDGTVYIGSNDGRLYAFDPADPSAPKWSYATGSAIYAPPTIGVNGDIYVGTIDGSLYSLNAEGTVNWIFGTGGALRSAAAVDADGTVYTGSGDKGLYVLAPDGTLLSSYVAGDALHSSPAIGPDGTLYTASYDGVILALG
jgi:outer membrane protein assembly factor BamB